MITHCCMTIYQTKSHPFRGTDEKEIRKKALLYYRNVTGKTRRKPYLRSVYFKKEKIFLELFWVHIWQKGMRDRQRRLKLLPCAFELIEKTRDKPEIRKNPNNTNELLYRFHGTTLFGQKFIVQIKERIGTKRKWLMSVFPV